MSTSAKVITDSISESGIRLCTLVLEYPRIIHSEVMTHRMFSRNASSSRAIPVEKQIERIENDPFIPTYWGANQKGMQAYREIGKGEIIVAEKDWLIARDEALYNAQHLSNDLGVHKQLANRLLEPFSHIQVVVTATEWSNFFLQRLDKNAQPEIQELAKVMKEAMENSTPKLLKAGEWHLPFITKDDYYRIAETLPETQKYNYDGNRYYEKTYISDGYSINNGFLDDNNCYYAHYGEIVLKQYFYERLLKLSVARCARVSYGLNERGWGDIEKDLALYDMLLENGHWSPFEHQATPMGEPKWCDLPMDLGITHSDRYGNEWSGNFKGWIQNRQLIQQQ